ncbi:hypothetical protein B0F90DRAFT_1675710 [Multifurca ochricompacta]|uniref:Uncharacterized protein n=1 Tax=Multifurca ochricompacta TaxID=376703 RepID=A0AAD4MEU4_9AGAM|nr:hypothetical protein B0F90DRAFT_1675710 [Multifurca ochricompacta]
MRPALSVVLLFLSLVSAINFQVPNNITSGGPATISWSSGSGDPQVFSLELSNPTLFHDALALANNVEKPPGTSPLLFPSSRPRKTSGSVTNPTGSSASTTGFGVTVSSTRSSGSSGSASSSGASSSASPSTFNGNGNGAIGSYVDNPVMGSVIAAVMGIVAGAVFV